MGFKSDIEIAQETTMQPITEVAKTAGIDEKYLELAVRALHKAFGLDQPEPDVA